MTEQGFTIETAIYHDGESQGVRTLGHREGSGAAHTLASHYLVSLLMQGATATYSKPHNEFRVARADGVIEYVRVRRH